MLCLVTGPRPKQLVLIRTTRMCHYFQLEWNLKYQYCATLDLARPPKAPGLTACFLFPLCSQWDEVGSSERLFNYWGTLPKGIVPFFFLPLCLGHHKVSSLLCGSHHNGPSHHCLKATAPNASWTGTSEQFARVNISLIETESSQEAHPQMEFPFESSIIAFFSSKIFVRWQSLNLHMIQSL